MENKYFIKLLAALGCLLPAVGGVKASSISTCTVVNNGTGNTSTATGNGDNASSCNVTAPTGVASGEASATANGGLTGLVSGIAMGTDVQAYSTAPNLGYFNTASVSTSVDSTFYFASQGPVRLGTLILTYNGGDYYASSVLTITEGATIIPLQCANRYCLPETMSVPFELGTEFSIKISAQVMQFQDSIDGLGTLPYGKCCSSTFVYTYFSLTEPTGNPVNSIELASSAVPEPSTLAGCSVLLIALLWFARAAACVSRKRRCLTNLVRF